MARCECVTTGELEVAFGNFKFSFLRVMPTSCASCLQFWTAARSRLRIDLSERLKSSALRHSNASFANGLNKTRAYHYGHLGTEHFHADNALTTELLSKHSVLHALNQTNGY